MARKLIDLSMSVHNNMVSFPRVVRPALVMYEDWRQFAERIGATQYGVDWLTAHCLIVLGDHIGTHMDSLRHMRDDAPGSAAWPCPRQSRWERLRRSSPRRLSISHRTCAWAMDSTKASRWDL